MQNLRDAKFFLTEDAQGIGELLVAERLDDADVLDVIQTLRQQFTPEQTSGLITLAKLRQRASRDIPAASQLFFTREALEQATAWAVARYRAQWIHEHAQPGKVLDLGCGIGIDLLHLAQYRPVVAYEQDPVRAYFAQANVDVLGLTERVEIYQADWTAVFYDGTLPNAAVAFVDPVRRLHGKRIFDVEKMIPPLKTILDLRQGVRHCCIKIHPGIQDRDIPSGAGVKFISHKGVCKEAMLWLDFERAAERLAISRSAAVYVDGHWHDLEATQQAPPLGEIKDGNYLHEPDPALIRAGAFWELCQAINGWLFDPQIAYLVTAQAINHPLVQSFHILEVHPFTLKKLNQRISVLGIGSVELKKRGMPFEPESMRKRLRLVLGGRPAVIIFTRRGQERLMIIAER